VRIGAFVAAIIQRLVWISLAGVGEGECGLKQPILAGSPPIAV